LRGLSSADLARREADLREALRAIRPVARTYVILRRHAALRQGMRPTNGLKGDVDMQIAAAALERDMTIVTKDGD
jgi:predicted nucleic acid-binding protein